MSHETRRGPWRLFTTGKWRSCRSPKYYHPLLGYKDEFMLWLILGVFTWLGSFIRTFCAGLSGVGGFS
jgi:hypothetical protein